MSMTAIRACPACGKPLFMAYQGIGGHPPVYFTFCPSGTSCSTFDDDVYGKGETQIKAYEAFQECYRQKHQPAQVQ